MSQPLGALTSKEGRSPASEMIPVQQLDLTGLHVLDGGLATELERRGFDLDGPLWSAQVLESSPEAVVAVHREYLEAVPIAC